MNEETRQTFTEVLGLNPDLLSDSFAWILLVTLGIMLLVILKNTANQRAEDKEFTDIDAMYVILRALALMLVLILIFT